MKKIRYLSININLPIYFGTQNNAILDKNYNTDWLLNFDVKMGGPEQAVFDSLQDWMVSKNLAIKHFSCTAVYRKNVVIDRLGKKVVADLGNPGSIELTKQKQ